jgi:hypothetical protein
MLLLNNQTRTFIQIPTYKNEWVSKINVAQSWTGNSIAGILALLALAAIIGVAVKR